MLKCLIQFYFLRNFPSWFRLLASFILNHGDHMTSSVAPSASVPAAAPAAANYPSVGERVWNTVQPHFVDAKNYAMNNQSVAFVVAVTAGAGAYLVGSVRRIVDFLWFSTSPAPYLPPAYAAVPAAVNDSHAAPPPAPCPVGQAPYAYAQAANAAASAQYLTTP